MATEHQKENVELARRGIEAFNAGDQASVLGFLDPEVEVFTAPGLINAGTYHGIDGFLAWAAQWLEAWDDFRNEIERVYAVGNDHVVVELWQAARGAGSGIPVEMRIAYMFEVRDQRATRLHLYPDAAEARAAAERLSGEPDS